MSTNLSQAKLIVVKVGSSLVTAEGRGIDQDAPKSNPLVQM